MARVDFFAVDYDVFLKYTEALERFEGHAGPIIDEVLHKQGGKLINDAIINILPESGRTWAGKKVAAKRTQPFVQEDGSMFVTIRTKPAYHYLYFPDDGTNTKFHVGEQDFMGRGAWSVSNKIIDLCVNALTNEIGE